MHQERTNIFRVADWLVEAETSVVFTGAGISTDSGIPDFRSPSGVWSKNRPVYFDEFRASAEARYEYWRQKSEAHQHFAAATPNVGHQVIARWGDAGIVEAVITQNIDGLHQQAGNRTVLELHGTARQVGCLDCEARFDADEKVADFRAADQVPQCPHCGGMLKHATISFGQALADDVLETAVEMARQADLFLAIGSSLVVEPAASLPRLASESGAKLVIINRDTTPLDPLADAVLHISISETLQGIARCIDGRLTERNQRK